jgi:hypothetical protein
LRRRLTRHALAQSASNGTHGDPPGRLSHCCHRLGQRGDAWGTCNLAEEKLCGSFIGTGGPLSRRHRQQPNQPKRFGWIVEVDVNDPD